MSIDTSVEPEAQDGDQVLYRFFDADGRLLYIGITNDPSTRFNQHRRKRAWWPLVARTERQSFCTRTAVEVAEQEAIEREKPLFNTIYNRGRGKSARSVSSATGEAGCCSPLAPDPLMDACLECFSAGYPLTGYPAAWITSGATGVRTIHRCTRRHTWLRTRTAA